MSSRGDKLNLAGLSQNDKIQLVGFRQFLVLAGEKIASGMSHHQASRAAALEVYGDIHAEGDLTATVGAEGIRDTAHPCTMFVWGEADERNRCEGDGHYLCGDCGNRKADSPEGVL